MEESNNKLLFAALGTIAVVIVIAIIWSFLSKGQSISKSQLGKVDAIQNNMEMASYSGYDGTTVTGSDVISSIRMYAGQKVGTSSSVPFTITVKNAGTFTSNSNVAGAYDKIEPMSEFKATLVVDSSTKLVTGLNFK